MGITENMLKQTWLSPMTNYKILSRKIISIIERQHCTYHSIAWAREYPDANIQRALVSRSDN